MVIQSENPNIQKVMTPRADALPDFTNPPLNEVVLGVQFAALAGAHPFLAANVWSLFRSDFPHVEEQPPLAPQFEVFGGAEQQLRGPQIRFGFGMPSQPRYWFLAPNRDELIQYQPDRLLHNWRKVGDGSNAYPRFEAMIKKFEHELSVLDQYTKKHLASNITINQCEISYINTIDTSTDCTPSRWLKLLNFYADEADDGFSLVCRRIIKGENGKPMARLQIEAGTARTADGKDVIALNLTVRGTPKGGSIAESVQFLTESRKEIAMAFISITTELAQRDWGRIQ